MNVDVGKIQAAFTNERWNNYLQEEYMVKTCSKDDSSSYTREERNLDRFLIMELLENTPELCTNLKIN